MAGVDDVSAMGSDSGSGRLLSDTPLVEAIATPVMGSSSDSGIRHWLLDTPLAEAKGDIAPMTAQHTPEVATGQPVTTTEGAAGGTNESGIPWFCHSVETLRHPTLAEVETGRLAIPRWRAIQATVFAIPRWRRWTEEELSTSHGPRQ